MSGRSPGVLNGGRRQGRNWAFRHWSVLERTVPAGVCLFRRTWVIDVQNRFWNAYFTKGPGKMNTHTLMTIFHYENRKYNWWWKELCARSQRPWVPLPHRLTDYPGLLRSEGLPRAFILKLQQFWANRMIGLLIWLCDLGPVVYLAEPVSWQLSLHCFTELKENRQGIEKQSD